MSIKIERSQGMTDVVPTNKQGTQHSNCDNTGNELLCGPVNLLSHAALKIDKRFKCEDEKKLLREFMEEYSYVLDEDEPADFGDAQIHYVDNPAAKIFGQRIYHASSESHGGPGVMAAAVVISAAAACVSAAAAVTMATSATSSTEKSF